LRGADASFSIPTTGYNTSIVEGNTRDDKNSELKNSNLEATVVDLVWIAWRQQW